MGTRLIDSTPPATTTWTAPACTCWAPSAIAWRPEEQKRLMVMAPAVVGTPARRAAWRATLLPCSASGIAQPRTTSSTISGFTAGTRASAPWMTAAAMSSGRVSRSDLPALPTAVLTLDTTTASRMTSSPISVPQRRAFLERVLDALLRLLRAEERQEGLALEVQEMLLARRPRRAVAPAEDRGHVRRHERVVLADVAAPESVVDAHLERGEGGSAEHGHVRSRTAWPMTGPREPQRHFLGVGDEPVGVRRERVRRGQEHPDGLRPRRRDPRERDRLEGALQEREGIRVRDAAHPVVGAERHLLRAPAAGH